MPSYTVTITSLSTPAVSASSSGISYNELINSLGYYNFLVQEFFLQSLNISQLQQTFMFETYDSNGTQYIRPMANYVDPYQKQASLYVGAKQESVLINSRTSINFPLLSLESLSMQVFAKENYIGDYLKFKNKYLATDGSGLPFNFFANKRGFSDRPIKKDNLYLKLVNNTTSVINVSVLSQSPADNAVFNSTTQYEWNVTNETYTGATQISIEAKPSGSSFYTTYTAPLLSLDADGIVTALNSLNIGIFWKHTAGSFTFIRTTNNSYQYNTLTVIGSSSPVLPPTTLNWSNNTTIPGGSLSIDENSINQVNDPNGSLNTGNFSTDNGDSIDVNVQASPGENTDFTITRTLIAAPFTTDTLYYANVAAGNTDNFSFTIDSDYTYNVEWGTPP